MSRYENNYENGMPRQRDLVLAPNEYALIRSNTDGCVKAAVGPMQASLSQAETTVVFDSITKRFLDRNDYEAAKQTFVSAPEGWYIVLKNPAKDNCHPTAGRLNTSPELQIGRKIVEFGPASFALYPGQMAKAVQGHRLRSNQYLLARVYDAEAANGSQAIMTDAEGNLIEEKNNSNTYFTGQILVIKGTEVSFYMPPTGIEVVYAHDSYVQDAVTLERLEYCILKNENGNKRYERGPQVVFPQPTEMFVETKKGSGNYCFRAIELSPISGIYIKVIAEYDEKIGDMTIHHPIGEEMFLTGNEQTIYYPRAEHATIMYDGKYMHHAIAIPKGEGRYVMNRLTGEIKTVIGPKMYLPDPRTEVIVKRKLTRNECELWYPGNREVVEYNNALTEKSVEKSGTVIKNFVANSAFNDASSIAVLETNAGISRGTSYTKPRTITLDAKYDGVVTINVWAGYAVSVIDRAGNRDIVIGPATRLLNYDETLEAFSFANGQQEVYLHIENNHILDQFYVKTKDLVGVQLTLDYTIDFDVNEKDKWFNVNDYIRYLCDQERTQLKQMASALTVEEFYSNSTKLITDFVLDKSRNHFDVNGITVTGVGINKFSLENSVAAQLCNHQEEVVTRSLELSSAQKTFELTKQIEEYKRKTEELEKQQKLAAVAAKLEVETAKKESERLLAEMDTLKSRALHEAQLAQQEIINKIHENQLNRTKAEKEFDMSMKEAEANLKKDSQKAYAEQVAHIMESVTPELVEAMQFRSNAELMSSLTANLGIQAISENIGVADVANKLLRGTSMEEVLQKLMDKNTK